MAKVISITNIECIVSDEACVHRGKVWYCRPLFHSCQCLWSDKQQDYYNYCPNGYTLLGKSTCLSEIRMQWMKSEMEKSCQNDGATLGGPFPADVWDDFPDYMKKELTRQIERYQPWIGIARKPQYGLSNDEKWKYVFDDEEFDADDYPFFHRQAQTNEDCAYLSPSNQFKVIPTYCSDSRYLLCQKNESPCKKTLEQDYMDFYGICISGSLKSDTFDNIRRDCINNGGDLLSLRNDSVLRSAKNAIYNFVLCGGLYTGLERSNGEWKYLDGSPGPSDDYWIKDDPMDDNCTQLKIQEDFSLKYFSHTCMVRCGYVCRIAHDTRLY